MLPFPFITLDPGNRGSSFESPPRCWDFSSMPIPLKPTEEFDIFATQNAAGAQTEYCLVMFSNGRLDPLNRSGIQHQGRVRVREHNISH